MDPKVVTSIEWKKDFKYGPPPFSFYKKDWIDPQHPIRVIITHDRPRGKKVRSVNFDNLAVKPKPNNGTGAVATGDSSSPDPQSASS